jgi:hypothetical protein
MRLKTTLFFLIFSSLLTFAQEFKSPVDYLNYIGKEQTAISKSMWKYTSTIAHSKSGRRIEAARKMLVKSIQTATKKISDLKEGYKGDVEFKNQMLEYLKVSENHINEDYGKIIDLQDIAEQSYDYMEAYILARDLVNKKMESENDKVNNAQKTFANKYNITISEDISELSKKMRISNEVFDYHTAVYLIFFKANFTDGNLSKAIEKKDLGAIQQNANSLIQYSTEGLEKLKSLPAYKNDLSLANSTKKALEFYKKQAEKFIPNVVDFFMFNEKFDNAKKTLDAKSQKDRSKEEIENYNALVKQVNKEIEKYNKANTLNFQDKSNALNNWNTVGDNFISRHVPQE